MQVLAAPELGVISRTPSGALRVPSSNSSPLLAFPHGDALHRATVPPISKLLVAQWGPADWYVVASGAAALLGLLGRLLWVMSDPMAWSSWRQSFGRQERPSDPAIRGTPAPRAPDAHPRPQGRGCGRG